jgi:hypothetical protein
MNQLLQWLTRPPRALQQANDEIAYLRGEVKRLSDLLTQAYAQARIIPRQPEHQGPPPAAPHQRKTYGEMQAESLERAAANYAKFQEDEQARVEKMRQGNGKLT